MKNVLEQAQKLAGSILESEEFIAMRLAEDAVTRDAEATRLIADFIEKRQQVQTLLEEKDLSQGKLSSAGEEMESAQKEMNGYPLIGKMQSARAEFSAMMDKVNALIRFVVTGETQQNDTGCSGSCEGCSGCRQ